MGSPRSGSQVSVQRSGIMRAVKSVDTAPERLVRKLAFQLGYRYRLHSKSLPGKPDLVFTSRKKAIFVNGCFWHGHDCQRGARLPKTNTVYWRAKIENNRLRDRRVLRQIRAMGWRALVIWECRLMNEEKLEQRIARFLSSQDSQQ
jgi:DNA mismatch endonuclease (patch repair protein)